MLVLTRKTNQQIQIGENVVITILHVRGQSVRVGIEAPRQLRVVRSEIADLPVEVTKQEKQPAGSEACQTMSEPETPASQATRPEGAKRRAPRLPTDAGAVCSQPSRRVQTSGCFSAPLADRVTAVVESSATDSRVVGPFAVRSFAAGPDERGYLFQVGGTRR
jgi:carbon storage regulator CsrA